MRDVFYTLLVVWIIWRVMNSVNTIRGKQNPSQPKTGRKTGDTTIDYIPETKKINFDKEGEYVDYEEVK